MNKYFVYCEIGAGMFSDEVIEEETLEHAEEAAREMCIELADSYGFYQDEDYFGELDSVGRDWDEEYEEYVDQGFLDYYAEEFVEEVHGDYL